MKALRLFFFFILSVLIIVAVLMYVLPTYQKVERTVVIKAPAAAIYNELSKLENFNKFSVWSQRDPAAKFSFRGKDGTVDAVATWKGDPALAGDGKIEITALEPDKKIVHNLSFSKPKKGNAKSSFLLNEVNGTTSVTWLFELATPRPWNIFNLFASLDKEMGKDFDEGLAMLKAAMEKSYGTEVKQETYKVEMLNFPATNFAAVKQQIRWADLQSFYAEHLPIVIQEVQNAGAAPGTASGLIFSWDEKLQQANYAVAVPVAAETSINNPIVQLVKINASKAIAVTLSGGYEKLPDVYASLRKYINENDLKEKSPVIEQYFFGPVNEKDTSKWLTKIVMLVE
ncbi:MAG: Polyketide cyclase / dehydrase and lipid transport [Bacteroidetes bacterium ADurb.BinA245]|nr:MAG: Polyketide cyclase / dehydrase and lipid transport [Bacteroidetes bacterium ADurb.BinA245]HNL59280.1 GyrI-like domain-containing protein [Chitinophagaceae bacterium]HRF24334.1 GyrI-like domain-containing protein [Chitinophagaceae bacterium]